MAKGDAISEEQARLALLSLANGANIGKVAKDMGLHHQTLKRLLIEFDSKAFAEVYAPKPKPSRPIETASPLQAPVAQKDTELDSIRKELRAGLTIREVAKRRGKTVKAIAALLPPELLAEVAPKRHEDQQVIEKRGRCLEILRFLQMDIEPEGILARVPGSTDEQISGLKEICENDTLGSRWALKSIGPFFCFSGQSKPLKMGKVTMPSVLVRCRCGHEQWKSTAALSMGIAQCEKCGVSR